ncbi:MAG: hypothetical protein ACTSRL_14420 [Candidatus Helarchaeota archaeon]
MAGSKLKYLKYFLFLFGIALGIIFQILIYSVEPLSGESGFWIQSTYLVLFYLPLLLILLTFPRPSSIKWQLIVINILILCLILASMNIDYQVLRIFSLGDSPPPNISELVWDKTYNLYWVSWTLQTNLIFLIFAVIYRFTKNDTWTLSINLDKPDGVSRPVDRGNGLTFQLIF